MHLAVIKSFPLSFNITLYKRTIIFHSTLDAQLRFFSPHFCYFEENCYFFFIHAFSIDQNLAATLTDPCGPAQVQLRALPQTQLATTDPLIYLDYIQSELLYCDICIPKNYYAMQNVTTKPIRLMRKMGVRA